MDLILAQGNGGAGPVDPDQAISWAREASQLGVAGLALLFMFLALGFAWWQMRKNADQERRIGALERDYREKVEALLREMLDRGEDSNEAHGELVGGLTDVAHGISHLTSRIEYLERDVRALGTGFAPPPPQGPQGPTSG